MTESPDMRSSAAEPALGYTYQARFALLRLLQLPEDNAVLMEKDDDLDFVDGEGGKSLASLKHKATGDRLTDLSPDFWKSINIWLSRYKRDKRTESVLSFFLFTTSKVSEDSFLVNFLRRGPSDTSSVLTLVEAALLRSTSQLILPIKAEFDQLSRDEKLDFLSRVMIFDSSPRIEDVPEIIIDRHMRTVQRDFRRPIYEHLEGWWNNLVIELLSKIRTSEVFGHEVSDKLVSICDEYKTDNLPIDFRGAKPEGKIYPEKDPRLFVAQLREIGISIDRIQYAIYDYFRAFKQRSSWARENVLVTSEIEDYEDRLIEEWGRFRDVLFENLDIEGAESALREAGKELYRWAELDTGHLRIRARVSELYVVRGNFHILANERPSPKVYWHPRFLERLDAILTGSSA